MSRKPRRRKTDRLPRRKRPENIARRRGCLQSVFGFLALAGLVVLTELDWCGCWMQRDHPAHPQHARPPHKRKH